MPGRDGAVARQPAMRIPVKRTRMAGSGSLVEGAADRWHHATTNDDQPPSKRAPRSIKQEKEGPGEGGGSCKRLKRIMEFKPKSKPAETSKLSLKRNTKPNPQHTDTAKRPRGITPTSQAPTVTAEEKDTKPSQEAVPTNKPTSKLPVPEKTAKAPEETTPHPADDAKIMLTKVENERVENPINLALAHRIEQLQAEHERLLQENSELREELDLMEFRMLEMDTSPKRAVSRGSETRFDVTELDDVSDSGVMSLPTSEDDPQEFGIEGEREKDVKWRLMEMCRGVESVADRICLQQAMALIRHQEARIEGLEATVAAISHEARTGENECKRIVATVPPFSEPRCLEESGVFLGGGEECGAASRGTQTEAAWGSGDLSQELRKLTRVRERIEERGAEPKEVIFYRERVEALEQRLQVFESSGDARVRALAKQVQRETLLEAKVKQLNQRVSRLETENRRLEEERCELEEAENDTRLRCQKLELKLSALGEKKTALKLQLEEASRTMANIRSALESEERKKNEARIHASRMEALIHSYEQKNLELEEREREVRYRLQMLENTMPALMMWNMWRMIGVVQGGQPVPRPDTPSAFKQVKDENYNEEELLLKLNALENKLTTETKLLEESRRAEDALQEKIKALEKIVGHKEEDILEILDRDPDKDVEVFEKLSKMARDRLEMDKRIKDLELKERLYQETLQQADNMFAEMEGGYAEKMKRKDEELEEQNAKLADSESKLKRATSELKASTQLQEKIDVLETEVYRLKDSLHKKERERENLEAEEKRLYKELQDCLEQLDVIKSHVEGPLRGELEQEKKRSKVLEEAIHKAEEEMSKKEEAHKSEVSSLKRQINRLNRDMLENEVTISELKEEVQTLEAEVLQLRQRLSSIKEESAEIIETLEADLEKREKKIEDLRAAIEGKEPPKEKSLKEELEEGYDENTYSSQITLITVRDPYSRKETELEVAATSPQLPRKSSIESDGLEISRKSQEQPKRTYSEDIRAIRTMPGQTWSRREDHSPSSAEYSGILWSPADALEKSGVQLSIGVLTRTAEGAVGMLGRTLGSCSSFFDSSEGLTDIDTKEHGSKFSLVPEKGNDEMIDQEIISSKGEFRGISVDDIVSKTSQQHGFPDEQRVERKGSIFKPEVKTRSAKELVAMINEIDRSQPLVDHTTTDVRGGDVSPFIHTPECLVAQKAVAGISGKDLKGTVDNLAKAYHHSKMEVNPLH